MELQVFTLRFLKYDFKFYVYGIYENQVSNSFSTKIDSTVTILWRDGAGCEKQIVLLKTGSLLKPIRISENSSGKG